MVVRDLRKKMMDHMGSDIMMDVIDQSVITIKCRKSAPQITPFLSKIRKKYQHLERATVTNLNNTR